MLCPFFYINNNMEYYICRSCKSKTASKSRLVYCPICDGKTVPYTPDWLIPIKDMNKMEHRIANHITTELAEDMNITFDQCLFLCKYYPELVDEYIDLLYGSNK